MVYSAPKEQFALYITPKVAPSSSNLPLKTRADAKNKRTSSHVTSHVLKVMKLLDIPIVIETGLESLCLDSRLLDGPYRTYGHKLIVAKSVQNTLCLQVLVKEEKS